MPQGKPRDPRKEQFWRDTIAQQQHSGLSVADFCRRHRLASPSFYAWRRTLAQRQAHAQPLLTFVPLHLRHQPQDVTPQIEVLLDHGRRIRVPTGCDAATLHTVLAALREVPC